MLMYVHVCAFVCEGGGVKLIRDQRRIGEVPFVVELMHTLVDVYVYI